jgi:sphingomyelin phosphodiesterase
MALAFHEVCLILQLSSPRVCVGLIEQMKETVHFIRQNSKLKSTEVCGVLLGSQCFIGRSEHLFWRLDIPGVDNISQMRVHSRNGNRVNALSQSTRQILHLTDIHMDLEYQIGSHIECNEPICCRSTPFSDNSSTISGEANVSAGTWGAYPCDIPIHTVENAFKEISKNSKSVDLWYWTGDIVAHDIWQYSRARNIAHLQIIAQFLHQYTNGSRIVPVIGNHEAVPINWYLV